MIPSVLKHWTTHHIRHRFAANSCDIEYICLPSFRTKQVCWFFLMAVSYHGYPSLSIGFLYFIFAAKKRCQPAPFPRIRFFTTDPRPSTPELQSPAPFTAPQCTRSQQAHPSADAQPPPRCVPGRHPGKTSRTHRSWPQSCSYR